MSSARTIPSLYGGKQQEYLQAAEQTVQKGVVFVKEALSKADVDCQALFYQLFDMYAAARGRIAKEHKSKDAEDFGHMRNAIGAKQVHFTYLDQQYLAYGDRLKKIIAKQLPRLMKGEQVKLGDANCQIHFRTFDIPKKRQISEEKGVLAVKDDQEGADLISAIGYKSEANMAVDLFQIPQGMLRFVSAQVYWKVGNDLIPASEYLCLYDATLQPQDAADALLENPEEVGPNLVQNKPCVMIKHMDKKHIVKTMALAAALFEKIITKKSPGTLKDDLAEMRYRIAHIMPWERGSAALGEWLESTMAQVVGFTSAFPQDRMGDMEAFAIPYLPNFVPKYGQSLTLKESVPQT